MNELSIFNRKDPSKEYIHKKCYDEILGDIALLVFLRRWGRLKVKHENFTNKNDSLKIYVDNMMGISCLEK